MALSHRWQDVAAWAGLVGVTAISLGSIATAIAYSGKQGEAFNPLNHWVSELGELGVSELASVFNLSLIVGGVCFVIFGLTATRGGFLPCSTGSLESWPASAACSWASFRLTTWTSTASLR